MRVYGSPRLPWLPGPETPLWLHLGTAGVVAFGGVLVFTNLAAAITLATATGTLWVAVWLNQLTTPHLSIADRYHWERADAAGRAIVEHLPRVSALDRTDVRAAVQRARWDLAEVIHEQARLNDLHHAMRRAAAALPTGDTLLGELDLRQTRLTRQMQSVRAEIQQRVGQLEGLAAQSTALAIEAAKVRDSRASAERALRLLDRADADLTESAVRRTRIGAAAEFTERAEAILAAYRELQETTAADAAPFLDD